MQARLWESLYAVRGTRHYVVEIIIRGRHWSNCQREPAHVAETMKLMTMLADDDDDDGDDHRQR